MDNICTSDELQCSVLRCPRDENQLVFVGVLCGIYTVLWCVLVGT